MDPEFTFDEYRLAISQFYEQYDHYCKIESHPSCNCYRSNGLLEGKTLSRSSHQFTAETYQQAFQTSTMTIEMQS